MGMTFVYGEPVVVKRAATRTDPYSGQEVLDWTNVTTTTYPRCAVYPRSSVEPDAADRAAVQTGWTALLPSGADVTRHDRVDFPERGVTDREIDGDPFDYRHPMTGWSPGTVVNTKGVDG